MTTPDNKTITYEKAQLAEVICQLRFPPILSIEANVPALFQDGIRASFPGYQKIVEQQPPVNGQPQTVNNHAFISADGKYKLNLTKNFISLSTVSYTCWEDFAGWLDEPLGRFIEIYKPAYFERVGLRYINAISREKLGISGTAWSELISSEYLGILGGAYDEKSIAKCAVEAEMSLTADVKVKLHSGPGFIKRNVKVGNAVRSVQDPEQRFIFDQDVYSSGNIRLPDAVSQLEEIHRCADNLFGDAITDELHDALGPVYS